MHNFKPKKSLGQNFLINRGIVEKIIDAAEMRGTETVVEIGPGFGTLTEALLTHAKRVIAIEKDARLIPALQKKFAGEKKLELVRADALQFPPPKKPYMLIANIPYYIASPLLDHFIRDNPKNIPSRAVLMLKKEVAQKLCAQPPQMNVLALHVQTFGTPKIIATVSKGSFRPVPKVDSAIVRIDFFKEPPMIDYEKYFSLIHRGFSQKRKMLGSLIDRTLLEKVGIDPARRAQTLSVGEWEKLLKEYIHSKNFVLQTL